MHYKVTLVMEEGRCEKAHVTDAETIEEAIAFMKEMRPGVRDVIAGWERAEQWESEQSNR